MLRNAAKRIDSLAAPRSGVLLPSHRPRSRCPAYLGGIWLLLAVVNFTEPAERFPNLLGTRELIRDQDLFFKDAAG